MAGNELSDSSVLDFVVTGMKPVSGQSTTAQTGQTVSFDLAILSLNTLGDPTSRMITQRSGEVYYWAEFDKLFCHTGTPHMIQIFAQLGRE